MTLGRMHHSLEQHMLEQRCSTWKWRWQVQKSFLPARGHRRSELLLLSALPADEKRWAAMLRLHDAARQSLAVAIGDVSGKGMPAALMMARPRRAALCLLAERTTGDATTRLNHLSPTSARESFRHLRTRSPGPSLHRITMAIAGHPPPLLRRNGHGVEPVAPTKPACRSGIVPDFAYDQVEFHSTPATSSSCSLTDSRKPKTLLATSANPPNRRACPLDPPKWNRLRRSAPRREPL